MLVLKDNIHIQAPVERLFLLSTSLAIVQEDLGMRPVRGSGATRTEGLAVGGDQIRWEGWQLGMWHYHVSLIEVYEPYRFFRDSMVAGRFRMFQHDHEFTEIGGQVLLKDTVRFAMPFGPMGRKVGKHVMVPHIRRLLRRRFARLKRLAESNEWRAYLPSDAERD